MISTTARFVWGVGGVLVVFAVAASVGLMSGFLHLTATPLCIALIAFATCLWYTNAYLEVRDTPYAWGLVTNAAGWGAVSLAFLAPRGWNLPFSLLAAGLIAAGGVAAWLASRGNGQGVSEGGGLGGHGPA